MQNVCTAAELVRCLQQWNSCWSTSGSKAQSFSCNKDNILTVSNILHRFPRCLVLFTGKLCCIGCQLHAENTQCNVFYWQKKCQIFNNKIIRHCQINAKLEPKLVLSVTAKLVNLMTRLKNNAKIVPNCQADFQPSFFWSVIFDLLGISKCQFVWHCWLYVDGLPVRRQSLIQVLTIW